MLPRASSGDLPSGQRCEPDAGRALRFRAVSPQISAPEWCRFRALRLAASGTVVLELARVRSRFVAWPRACYTPASLEGFHVAAALLVRGVSACPAQPLLPGFRRRRAMSDTGNGAAGDIELESGQANGDAAAGADARGEPP